MHDVCMMSWMRDDDVRGTLEIELLHPWLEIDAARIIVVSRRAGTNKWRQCGEKNSHYNSKFVGSCKQ